MQTVELECTYNSAVVVTSFGQFHEIFTAPGRVFDIHFDLKSSHGRLDRHPGGVSHHLNHGVSYGSAPLACSVLDQRSTGSPLHAGCR